MSGKKRAVISAVIALLVMFESFVRVPHNFLAILVFSLVPFLAAYTTLGLLKIADKAVRYAFFSAVLLYFSLMFSVLYFPRPEKGLSRALFSSSGSALVIAVILHIVSRAIVKPASPNSNN